MSAPTMMYLWWGVWLQVASLPLDQFQRSPQ